jgi:S-adenosylmethionine synthetase
MDNGLCISENLFRRHILGDSPEITINPSGEWHIGGSISDCGMTNRKIVVDQYGGYAPVGGGGLSGKDMSKVDRSATYMCRYLAKNIVAAGIADTAKVELAYMIGVPQPCAINVELNRNQMLSDVIKTWIMDNIDLTPMGIMIRFDGSKPRYNVVTQFGHFGVNNSELSIAKEKNFFPWEETDLVLQMQDAFGS